MFLITYKLTGFNYELIINLSLTIIFIIIIFIDIDHHIIPDSMTLSIFILSIVLIIIKSTNQIEYDYISNIIGFIIGFSSLFLIRFISTVIYKKEAMGFGDVKLFATWLIVRFTKYYFIIHYFICFGCTYRSYFNWFKISQ